MNRKLRIGIIGAGGIARSAHIPNYQNYGDAVEVVAVANHNKEKAEDCAREFSISHAYEDYQDMLREMDLDAVSICTPNAFHAEQAIAAMESGCHVLCEKPPAISSSDAEKMEEAASRLGKHLMYGFHFRFRPEVETVKRFIDEGEMGEIYAAEAKWNRRRGIPGWGVFTNKELQGGGTLIDNGIHMLDSALYLMGYPEPKTVLGVTYDKIGKRPGVGLLGEWDHENFSVEDMARGMIAFQNGASLLFESSFAANIADKDARVLKVMGDQGGADVFPLTMYQEKHDTLLDLTPPYVDKGNAHKDMVHHFIESILMGQKTSGHTHQGTLVQRIIEALYESAATGKAVEM
ncbi:MULTISPECIES: Gfo/Idh/MocA family protein [Pontibacillus]|uniref:Gfo/Idh/MocA family oxidoreductase n=1 Tax=Pontibacillus chungwhensis TaxID=265426 RepID=A0ABY8V2X0_9BACI|nr:MULTISPECIES: Gfo/Idh/MocA family oxidoreductase [Pontibacillus]MCD5324540.1 Gfo/Idh/MocA family oxidoreductase [Pontibacillus sp. HN14]WIF99164.1 Gfo/Idh/MocA family oxidoreductase [Pontibacillus chungwhensis]